MTVLRLVTPEQHSVRADLTPENLADLEHITRHVLTPAVAVTRQLDDAIRRRDLERAKVAATMFSVVAANARDIVRQMEAER